MIPRVEINFPSILTSGLMIRLTLQLLFRWNVFRLIVIKVLEKHTCLLSTLRMWQTTLIARCCRQRCCCLYERWDLVEWEWEADNAWCNRSDQQQAFGKRYWAINAMLISQTGEDREMEMWREKEGKVKEIGERERGRGKEKVVAQLRLTLMRSLCDGTWQRRRKQNPPTPMLHNTPPLNWESQSPQRGCVCQKECVSVLGGVSECKTK